MVKHGSVHPIARLPEEWREALVSRGERAFSANQVFSWIHRRGVFDPAAMTNVSARLRASLAEEGLGPIAEVVHVHRSADGTRKVVLRLKDDATIETVLLPAVSGPGAVKELDADAAAADDDDAEDDEQAEPRTSGTPASRSASPRRSAARWAACSARAASPG